MSVDAPILATKLYVPPPRPNLVSRSRLRDRLSAMTGGRVTLVAAAAGWGKSTLLADWAISSPTRIAWLSLDAGDDEPRRFLNYVIAALRAAEAVGADVIDALSSTPEALQATSTELLNAIAARQAPVSLVLDDYHAIQSRTVHDVVQFIIDHLPPNLHLVIATRYDPPLALSRLRARGLLMEVRGDDLRFTADEAGLFLNGAMGLKLETSDVHELEQRTEGWPVGLQMAAISLSGREGSRAFIERFSGSNRYVLDYLTDEVLDRQPAHVRDFLLTTSILTRLTPSLCDAVTQRQDGEDTLAQLDRSNLFVIPLDDVRYWYRYHHLFATLLQHQLKRARSHEEIHELHRRASAWYEANRMPEQAIEHAIAAGDIDGAVRIVRTHSLERTWNGDMVTVVRWFDLLPAERIENSVELLLSRAMALLGDWQLVRAYDSAVRAESLLPADAPDALRGAVTGMRGVLERVHGRVEEGERNLERARSLVDPNTFWYTLVTYQTGLSSMMKADMRGMVEALAATRVQPSRPDQVLIAVLSGLFSGMGEWWRGNPDSAVAMSHDMLRWIDLTEKIVAGRPLDCAPYSVLAQVYCSWNELDQARAFATRGLAAGRNVVKLGLFEISRAMAHVAAAQRDWETAARSSRDAERAMKFVGAGFYWSFSVDALSNGILLRRGQLTGNRSDIDAVERWLRESNVVEKHKDWTVRRFGGAFCDASLLLAARLFIEKEKYDDAVAILDNVQPHVRSGERLLAEIETLILRSMIFARRGKSDESVQAMTHALDLASPPRYLRQFVEEGAEAAPIIERALPRLRDRDFGMRILSALSVPLKPAGPAEGLSEREVEVLRIIAAGASNQDAGRKLFIAASTVKKHLENIYAKLGVSGRTEAIAKAHQLKML